MNSQWVKPATFTEARLLLGTSHTWSTCSQEAATGASQTQASLLSLSLQWLLSHSVLWSLGCLRLHVAEDGLGLLDPPVSSPQPDRRAPS